MKRKIRSACSLIRNECIILAPEKDGLDGIVSISSGRYRTNWKTVPPHAHKGCIELCLCARGASVYECGGKHYSVFPNNMLAVQSGQSHHLTTTHTGMRLYWLIFRYPKAHRSVLGLSVSETAAMVKRLKSIKTHVFSAGDEMRGLFHRVFNAYKTLPRDAFRTLMLRSLTLQILLLTIECANNRPTLTALAKISHIADMIAKRPAHHFVIADLAKHVKLSESRFTFLFKQVIGQPPHAFQMKCRLETARNRMMTTDEKIIDIAKSLGFSSPQYLASQFRKTYGLTASDYRRTQHTHVSV